MVPTFQLVIKARLELARGNTTAADEVLTDIVHTLKEPFALHRGVDLDGVCVGRTRKA
jgi:hypothetical protein